MEQPQNQIYNAFKEAGLEKEARTLSISGVIKRREKKIIISDLASYLEPWRIVMPAIGHYIAIVDNGPVCLINQ
ncbi:MAG: hypothetical protein AABW67_05890, partial [Nanoarchaeota archaeon]